MNPAEHIWLTSLTNSITFESANKLIFETSKLKDKDDIAFADSIVQVAISKNRKTFNQSKEEANMCEALMELMKPEMDALIADLYKEIESLKAQLATK